MIQTTEAVWIMARNLAATCRGQGTAFPSTDLLIAATARVHGLAVLEVDHHFGMIPADADV